MFLFKGSGPYPGLRRGKQGGCRAKVTEDARQARSLIWREGIWLSPIVGEACQTWLFLPVRRCFLWRGEIRFLKEWRMKMSHRLWLMCVVAVSFLTLTTLVRGQSSSVANSPVPGSQQRFLDRSSDAYQDGGSATRYVYASAPKPQESSQQQGNESQGQNQNGNQNQGMTGSSRIRTRTRSRTARNRRRKKRLQRSPAT